MQDCSKQLCNQYVENIVAILWAAGPCQLNCGYIKYKSSGVWSKNTEGTKERVTSFEATSPIGKLNVLFLNSGLILCYKWNLNRFQKKRPWEKPVERVTFKKPWEISTILIQFRTYGTSMG